MNSLNLKLGDLPSSDWCDDFRDRLKSKELAEAVVVSPAAPPAGTLGCIDPTIVAAIIAGGVQIVATAITLLVQLWQEKRKAAESGQPILLVVIGSEGTGTLRLDPSELIPGNKPATKEAESTMPGYYDVLLRTLKGVGSVRGVEVK